VYRLRTVASVQTVRQNKRAFPGPLAASRKKTKEKRRRDTKTHPKQVNQSMHQLVSELNTKMARLKRAK
jgi:hypothetical protein